jgi:hypothetical protein
MILRSSRSSLSAHSSEPSKSRRRSSSSSSSTARQSSSSTRKRHSSSNIQKERNRRKSQASLSDSTLSSPSSSSSPVIPAEFSFSPLPRPALSGIEEKEEFEGSESEGDSLLSELPVNFSARLNKRNNKQTSLQYDTPVKPLSFARLTENQSAVDTPNTAYSPVILFSFIALTSLAFRQFINLDYFYG